MGTLRDDLAGATRLPWFAPMDGVIASHPERDPDAEWTLVLGYHARDTKPENIGAIVSVMNAAPALLDVAEAARAFTFDDYTWDRAAKGDPGPALRAALDRLAAIEEKK